MPVKIHFIDHMAEDQTVRVHFIDGTERIVTAKDFHWVGEEGARSATAIVDGREVPIYKRSEPEWGPLWYEQEVQHGGVCVECERFVTALNSAGMCEGCVTTAVIDAMEPEERWK